MKYTLKFKLECVEKYKKGIRIDLPPGVKHRATFSHYLMDWFFGLLLDRSASCLAFWAAG